jgi:hypothetical protein
MIFEVFRHIFEKYVNIKFHKNPSSGNRFVPRGHIRQTSGSQKSRFAILRKRLKHRICQSDKMAGVSLSEESNIAVEFLITVILYHYLSMENDDFSDRAV